MTIPYLHVTLGISDTFCIEHAITSNTLLHRTHHFIEPKQDKLNKDNLFNTRVKRGK